MSTQIRGNKQIKNITIQNEQLANGTIELDKLKDGSELIKRDGSVAVTGDFDFGSHQIKNLAAPVDANDAVRKADLDAVIGGSIVTREIPVGALNGSNKQFTLANVPNVGTEQVFLNGALLNTGANSDYVLEGDTITFTIAPQAGDTILVNYISDMIVVSLDINTSISQLNTRLTTAESELFTAQNDITALNSDLSGLDARVTVAETDIVVVEGDVASLQTSLSSVQSSVSSLTSSLSSEQSARIAADDALDTAVSSVQTSVTSLGNRMTQAESDITALEAADAAFDLRAGVIEDGLQAETNARTSADSALSSRVTALENAPDPVTALSALTDVTISNPTNNQILKYNGSGWVNSAAPATFSGSYNDLSDKPSLFSGSYSDLTNKPSLFSGSYNDLTNKPTIPSLTQVEADIADHETRIVDLESTAFVTREVPGGSVNGSNTVFTLANTPVSGTEQVFLNGLMQQEGAQNDYTISGSTITFTSAPEAGWKLFVNYATGNYTVAPGGNSGSSLTAFQWSSSEQVYPFEKDSDGSTLYCIEYNLGTVPVASSQITNLSTIQSGLLGHKIFRLECFGKATGYHIPIPFVYTASQPYEISAIVYDNKIEIRTVDGTWNSVGVQATARFIYKK